MPTTPKLTSNRTQRWLLWSSALVLAVGIAAVLIVFLRDTGTKQPERFTNQPVDVVPKREKSVELDPQVRRVAGRFILTAVQRKDLDEAWGLVGPGIRQDLTYKEWLTGEIPVVPYLDPINIAPIKTDTSQKNYALLEVILLPKDKKVRSEIFYMELIKVGKGDNGRWVVNSWSPRSHPTVPNNPNG